MGLDKIDSVPGINAFVLFMHLGGLWLFRSRDISDSYYSRKISDGRVGWQK